MNALPVTPFDVATSVVAAALYLAVAIAAWARAPRDIRPRTFLLTAIASAGPYGLAPLQYARGTAAALRPGVLVMLMISLAVGSLALFHFSQVFPWRRPWVRARARWLYAGYAICPVVLAVLAGLAPRSYEDVTASYLTVATVLGLPILGLVYIVLPLAGLLSLYKSWLDAKRQRSVVARSLLGIIVSQIAGGLLAVIVAPLIHVAAPSGPLETIVAAFLFLFGILMPVAFAAAVWHDGVLEFAPDLPTSSTSA